MPDSPESLLVEPVQPSADALDPAVDRLQPLLHPLGHLAERLVDPGGDAVDRVFELLRPVAQLGEGLVEPVEADGGGLHAALELVQPLGHVLHAQRRLLGDVGDVLRGLDDGLDADQALVDVLGDDADIGPQRGQFGDGLDPLADRLDVLGQPFGPFRGLAGQVVDLPADVVELPGQAVELALADLPQQPLHALQPLPYLIQDLAL